MIYTVVCTDINDYVHWQCELLEYSWSRINQPGKLVRLVACEDDQALPTHRHAEVFRTRPSNVHPQSGDVYVCYNRLYSLQQWLEEEDIQGTILMVDSDVVFRSPIKAEAERGSPIAQPWLDYGVSAEFRAAIENGAPAVDVDGLQPVTWPALIDAQDLRRLLPRWIDVTVEIREQIRRQESDMFGFLAAAQEMQLEFTPQTTTAFMPWPDDQVANAPIIHYCQEVKDHADQPLWSKFSYQPWGRIENPASAQLPYCVDLLNLVNEFAGIKASEQTHQNDTIFIAIASYCEPELIDTINSCLSKARHPQNLRFGICHQFDNTDLLTDEHCLDQFSQDIRFRYVTYDFKESQGGCWARNIAQQLYENEIYTLQIDAHTQMVESWDTILIQMLTSLPSSQPLITQFPPLYSIQEYGPKYHLINDFSQVNVGVAKEWVSDGWLAHSQQLIPEHNSFPRRTRFLSGAFVFTTGEWNQVVMQDPKHFYTGEEFALAVRSYTHGYDLFDPSQIVAWHRLHTQENRKFWSDNSRRETNNKHAQGVRQLNILLQGDPDGQLGRYGLGTKRSLDEFAHFSGIDCIGKTLSDEACLGIPPQLDSNQLTEMQSSGIDQLNGETLIDVTLHLENREPLLLTCYESTPILMELFKGLRRRSEFPNDVVHLNLGENGAEHLYFKLRQIRSIVTSPELSADFFERYLAQTANSEQSVVNVSQEQEVASLAVEHVFNDEWKIWIWKNIERGCSKDEIFQQLIQHGFSRQAVRQELNHEPSGPTEQAAAVQLQQPQVANQTIAHDSVSYVANPAAHRIDTDMLEIYDVENFLNADECRRLTELISRNLQRSTVIDASGADQTEHRTSRSCFFDLTDPVNALAVDVSDRVSRFIGINPSYAEPIQAQFYRPGEEYKAHYDWVDPQDPNFAATLGAGGQRTWSVLVYLNSLEVGGETDFPNANLVIKPELGKLVYWNNADPSGAPNHNTLHQACPVIDGEKAVLTLWYRSKGNGSIYQRQPHELIPRYTADGIRKQLMSTTLFNALSEFYASSRNKNARNEFVEGGFLQSDRNSIPSTMLDVTHELKQLVCKELQPICEQWSAKPLAMTSIYGIREYARGTSLKMHTDVTHTHIISVILNVAQTVDRDWPLEVDDHMCRRHSVILQPGEMLLYEGARLSHGRPTPLEGESFANIFVHFCPTDLEGV